MSNEAEELNRASEELERIIQDESVPQNIRNSLEEAREHLLDEDKNMSERAANGINILNDVSNDPNLPMHIRTQIWNISGELETITME
ncbi:MAG: UPF0147 family protein [Halobacteria archaeon]|nr:UPF0147 family protein [Halobacteria archaeon]